MHCHTYVGVVFGTCIFFSIIVKLSSHLRVAE